MSILERFSLRGQRALVTGSTQGIGLALARGLAEAGARVILNGRDEHKLAAAVDSLTKTGLAAEGVAFDVTDEAAIRTAVATLTDGDRAIDILVNNAGITRRFPLVELPLEEWQRVLQTDLTSAFLVAKAVAPAMLARRRGKIVNICSLMSELARPTIGAYSAAKGGLKMLTRSMCAEWAKENVQVNGIAPGYFETELTKTLVADPKFNSWICGRTPAGRWGQVSELAGACVFLCSGAADFVNGQILTVDGGLSAVI